MNRTVQREVILEELKKVKVHPTADEVYEMARRRIPNISIATVYRNLETMAAKGKVQKLELSGTKKRYDGDVSVHYHLRCRECGGVSDISGIEVEHKVSELESLRGSLGIEDFSLEFKGVCHECRAKKGRESL